ncbi:TPA: YadA-like family protein [Pasteurella multocida]|nr:YadA-like family protein [Pasteurella multocida]
MLEEKNKNIALQNNNIENQKKELAKQSKEIESVKNDLKVKIEELEAVKKELDVAQGKLAEIEQNEKVVATTQANDNLDINNTKVEPASISVSEELAENEKSVTTVVAPYINEQLENQKVAILATAQYMEKSAQIIANVHQDVAKLQHKYHQLQNTIQKNRHVSSRGIASIAAMSNIPVPAVAGKTTIGAGVGHFDRKNAIAIGASRYYENGTAVKVSLGTAGSNVAFGGGISYSF